MRKNTGSQFKYTSKGNNSTADVTELSGDVEGRGLLVWKDVEVRKTENIDTKITHYTKSECMQGCNVHKVKCWIKWF